MKSNAKRTILIYCRPIFFLARITYVPFTRYYLPFSFLKVATETSWQFLGSYAELVRRNERGFSSKFTFTLRKPPQKE